MYLDNHLICEDNPEDDVKHCKEGREAFQEELVDSEDKNTIGDGGSTAL